MTKKRAAALAATWLGCLLFATVARAGGGPADRWGVPIYPGATLESETRDEGWKIARYLAHDPAPKVLDFYASRYGEPTLEGGKWGFETKSPDLELEVAEIALGPDAGRTILYVKHQGGDEAAAKKAVAPTPVPASVPEEIWGVPIYPGSVRRGVMEAGPKKYVTFSTSSTPESVVEFYAPKYGKPGPLSANRQLIRATKQGVEITIAPASEGGAEITYVSTKPLPD